MKRSLCMVLCFLIQSFLLLASAQSTLAAEGKAIKIAMILWRGETQTEKGLKDGLKDLGYSVEYVTFDGDQDKEELAEILRNEIDPKAGDFDYVYTFGTTVTKMTKRILGNKVPLLFNAVSFPVDAEIVESMDIPGGNISGVTNTVPIEKQLEQVRKLVSFKKLGVVFNARERNAVLWAEELIEFSNKMDIEVVELDVSPVGHKLEQTLQKIIKKDIEVDAIYLPNDSFLISQAKLIGENLSRCTIPSIGAHEDFIKGGALMGLVAEYYELGRLAAEIVDQHQKGKKMGEIPIAKSKDPRLLVNRKTCDLLGIQVPKDVADRAQMIE